MLQRRNLVLYMLLTLLLAACGGAAAEPAVETAPVVAVDLAGVKTYAQQNVRAMDTAVGDLHETAQAYYDLLAAHDFDYAAAWAAQPDELAALVGAAKAAWIAASQAYELDEGIVAGVSSLAAYDVWIDAGPSKAEAPDEARPWTLLLADGRELDSPGNFFHSLLEPTIWGTNPDYTGMAVDLDGDGRIVLGEALPEANVLLAAAAGLEEATVQMAAALDAWQPTAEDAFTALVVMIPTMNEYFEQWKLSAFVAGEAAEETAFIGTSRLMDIAAILNGLNVTYDNLGALSQTADADQHAQIVDGFTDLRGYVDHLLVQEQEGLVFSADQADLFGTEAQSKATALAGQIAQVAALLDVPIAE
jgi:hypothetical protein